MKRLFLFFSLLLLMGCQNMMNEKMDEESAGLEHTKADEDQTPDELLLESRRQVRFGPENDELETREAERMVSHYIGKESNDTVVQYDHKENGKYILRVYSIEGGDRQEWYSVDLKTRKIEKLTR